MSKKKRQLKKFILVYSDTHIGSTVALWPDKFTSQSGHQVPQNALQEWLWECWLDMQERIAEMTKGHKLTTVCLGDVIEGQHHRTTEIMTPELDDQISATIEIYQGLKDKLKPTTSYFIRGTECHSKNIEGLLGNLFGSPKDDFTQQGAFDHLKLDVDGCVCSFAHHTSCTSRPYLEASAHSFTLGTEIMEAVRNGHTPPDVVCRAHRHRHGIWKDGNCMSVVTGAWQALTRHGRKVVPAAVPNPSVVLLEFVPGRKLPIDHELVYVPEESNIHKI